MRSAHDRAFWVAAVAAAAGILLWAHPHNGTSWVGAAIVAVVVGAVAGVVVSTFIFRR